jgi:ATPase subunit of ABC transporter with duplicated ATPase domains
MTAISARDLSFVTASGETIFAALDLDLPHACHGLVGRNGSGKSLLGRMLAGKLAASSGNVVRHVATGYLPQQFGREEGTLADALGIAPKLAALARIEAGSVDVADFEQVGDDWECAARWRESLADASLQNDLDRPLSQLSGGELTRVHLLRLFDDKSHYLILDEPSNHLDRHARAWLRQRLHAHPAGALVISHDRELLDEVAVVHDLSSTGIAHYGGNYTFYRACHEEELAAATRHVERAKHDLDAVRRERQRTLEKQNKRQQRAGEANLPHLAIGRREQQAQQTAGHLRNEQAKRLASSRARLREVSEQMERIAPQRIDIRQGGERGGFAVRLENLTLPYGTTQPLNFSLRMRERIHLDGRNGSGKSSLLRVIAGTSEPKGGRVQVTARRILIDQHFNLLDTECSALANLERLAPGHLPEDYRTFLAGIGLTGDRALTDTAVLSGG